MPTSTTTTAQHPPPMTHQPPPTSSSSTTTGPVRIKKLVGPYGSDVYDIAAESCDVFVWHLCGTVSRILQHVPYVLMPSRLQTSPLPTTLLQALDHHHYQPPSQPHNPTTQTPCRPTTPARPTATPPTPTTPPSPLIAVGTSTKHVRTSTLATGVHACACAPVCVSTDQMPTPSKEP